MRKLYVLLTVIMLASFAISACAPAAPAAEEVALNPYLGSNKLDGNGVPPTFFDDVHIRRAFAYCFDWQTVIDDIYKGEAVQSKTLALPGMPGYNPDQEVYTMDLDKCAEEFKLADVDKDGIAAGEDPDDIWEMGFRLQMLYNTGNTTRKVLAEIMQSNLSQVNEKFSIEVLGLPWPAYLAAQRAKKIPVMTAGWQEDIHDAHNWYQPYTVGAYGARQNMPDDLKAQFRAMLEEGVGLTDPAARAEVYYKFNQLYFDQVPGLLMVLATSHGYEQRWVEGRVLNPIYSGDVFKFMSKSADAKNPTEFTVATIGDIDTLDPALSYDTSSGQIVQNVYETLVFYDGVKLDTFVPMLATDWTTSEDGKTWTFNIRQGVKFHEGGDLSASDVAYSFQRGLLQGGYTSPQLLLAEPFLGVGNDDITMIVDEGASADDREALKKNDPAALKAACEKVQAAIVADDAAGTVTMTLAQPWGPFLATIANGWGSIMDKEWVMANGGWDGTCDTWTDFYGMTSAEDPFTGKANGTGAYKLENWTAGEQISMTKFDGYWGDAAKLDRVTIKVVPEFTTRFQMFQQGDADIIDVPVEDRPQVDKMVGELVTYDLNTLVYNAPVSVCAYDNEKLGQAMFTPCAAGETTEQSAEPFRVYMGRPGLNQNVIIFNFAIQ